MNLNGTIPNGWLAFELGVLRRLKFKSVSLAFAGEPELGLYLKRWGVRVAANDLAQWAATKAAAFIENNEERLSDEDVAAVLEDAYVPGHKLSNPALRKWFGEADAWSFDKQTRELRRPLSRVFQRIWQSQPAPVNNDQRNTSDNREARDFIAEQRTNLLYLRLPRARNVHDQRRNSPSAWREEWVRGGDGFWEVFEKLGAGRLG